MELSRREWLRAGALATAQLTASAQTALPNFVFLISDDHSAPDLGCYGNKVVKTPNLDRLAQQGARFNKCFVSSPQCSPNRSSIFTGCSPHTTGTSRLHTPMPPWETSFLEPLKEKGYFTGAFRKVHQGPQFDKRWDFYAGTGKVAGKGFASFFDALPKGKPFFLHVGFTDPHRKYAPGAFDPPHDPAKVTIPEWLPDTPEIRQDLAYYYDAIARMDAECGEVLRLLEERGLAENTLVLFTGDNGLPFPPRGKGTLYESGINVPFLARWPGKVRPGTVSDELVAHVDLPVTWLDAAGIAKPAKMQGMSQLPALLGRPHSPRQEVFSERNWHDKFDVCRCVRTSTHKLIYNGIPSTPFRPIGDLEESMTWESFLKLAKDGKLEARHQEALKPTRPVLEMYDLQADRYERNNLIDKPEHAAVQKDLLDRLTRWMDATYDFLPPPFREFPAKSGKMRSTL